MAAPEPGTRVVGSFRLFLEADLLVLLFNRDVAAREAHASIAGGADATGP